MKSELIKKRVSEIQSPDLINKYYEQYFYTENLSSIWGNEISEKELKEIKHHLNGDFIVFQTKI